ncbi:MAG: hypothetical protein PF495_17725 [Spirochaetales bacterium]|jgi:exoribonuclease II|nr:hypothetical protein [Spirochaetales bacterium]
MTDTIMRILAAALVDWRKAVTLLVDNPDYRYALATKQEVEEFFTDEWFEFLCNINPEFTNIHLQEM